jgi:single-stranded-DNA-specific exonuclease
METAKDAFVQFGGHKMAGGFEVSSEKIHTLENVLNEAFSTLPEASVLEPIFIDGEVSINDVDWDMYRHIERLAPFGIGNPKPIFSITNAEIKEVKQFGKEKNHLEISFDRKGKPLKAISFFTKPEKYSTVPENGKKVNVLATLEKSTFRSYPELRLRIVDII